MVCCSDHKMFLPTGSTTSVFGSTFLIGSNAGLYNGWLVRRFRFESVINKYAGNENGEEISPKGKKVLLTIRQPQYTGHSTAHC